jgi:ABC-type multidrug transport system ATPase subunit
MNQPVALVRISFTNKKNRKETFCFKDPYNRRLIWTIIRKLKSTGKCVLLTTHFLEEADVLSDRIAIMSRGRLQANGTPDFLKQQTGWKKINLTKIQIFDI